jgi:hypothetical protein
VFLALLILVLMMLVLILALVGHGKSPFVAEVVRSPGAAAEGVACTTIVESAGSSSKACRFHTIASLSDREEVSSP